MIDALLDVLFNKEDWTKATSEEVDAFIQQIRAIGEMNSYILCSKHYQFLCNNGYHPSICHGKLETNKKRENMGRKGQDGFDDRRKSHSTKKPVRKYDDRSNAHVRGYKEVIRLHIF